MTQPATTRRRFVFLAFLSALLIPPRIGAQSAPFDIVIMHGRIIDGTGSPWYSGDIGIRGGKIAAIGNLANATRTRTMEAHGQIVAPGFIDMLGQSELTILVDPRLPSKIYQGITTEITGEGESVAPLNDGIRRAGKRQFALLGIQPDWQTFRQYFARLEKQGIGINVADYVGATTVRRMVLGDDDVQPTPAQLDQMKQLVRQAMLDGAVGVSTSLEYPPAPFAKIEAARAQGVDIAADTYAYTAWGNGLSAFIPPWAHDGGTAKLLARLNDPAARERIRKDMLTASDDWENEWQQITGPESILI